MLLTAAMMAAVALTPGAARGRSPVLPDRSDRPATVTLLTGDQVTLYTVGGQTRPTIDPGEGRDDVLFSVHRQGETIEVLPSDAVALVGEGRLDRRLFDVTGLQRMGYSDADRPDLPLIVKDQGARQRVPQVKIRAAGAIVQPLPAAQAVGVHQPKATTSELWDELTRGDALRTLEAGVGKVWLDALAQPTLDVSVPRIGAPAAWAAGFTGRGQTVAVIDTGIDATHPDLAGRIADRRNFVDAEDDDVIGHGTHVASTIAGTGAASGGRYKGVAPDARLLDAKVCMPEGCPETAIIAGMQWAAESGAVVANMSLGGDDTPEVDPMEAAVDNLSAQYGTLFVAAAGNSGPAEASVGSPSTADAALSVAAVDDADQVAIFSSRGPRLGDQALKPDISAPGVDITAARARNGFGQPGQSYVAASGTSMATPHVAGSAALLRQQHPGWTSTQVKAVLMGAAAPADDAFAHGAGRVDVARAVTQQAYAEPASVSFGLQPWPHDDDEVLTRTLTYRNPGSSPLTLSLDVPASPFTLSANEVTVPAGGTATVEVTGDTRTGPDGLRSANITATSGTTRITTPVAVNQEVESYDLTIRIANTDAGFFLHRLSNLETGAHITRVAPDGTITFRVAEGSYLVDSAAFTERGEGLPAVAWLVQPLVEVSGSTTVELDAAQARPFTVDFADDVTPNGEAVGYHRVTSGGVPTGSMFVSFTDFEGMRSAHVGPEVGQDEMTTLRTGNWLVGPAKAYHLAWVDHGRMLTGSDEQVVDSRLAKVKADYPAAGAAPHQVGAASASARPNDAPGWDVPFGTTFPLPLRRTELYSAEHVQWTSVASGDGDLLGAPTVYEPGRTYRTAWSAAVRGPAPSLGRSGDAAFVCPNFGDRAGDVITLAIPQLTDAAGHSGCDWSSPSTVRLLRDGEVVPGDPSSSGYVVPPAPATYRFEEEIDRPSAAISTRVTAAWTFASQHVDGDDPAAIPLMAVRFVPNLNDRNQARAGKTLEVPVSVDKAGPVGRVRTPTVEASFDDGTTWTKVRVESLRDGRYVAEVRHPSGAQHVSLRAKATDNRGNAVEQTILRAYLLG